VANFAIVNSNTITNVIVAENKEIALQIVKADDAIETTGIPWIGWVFIEDKWIDPNAKEFSDESSTEL
jgi:hypothetical protein